MEVKFDAILGRLREGDTLRFSASDAGKVLIVGNDGHLAVREMSSEAIDHVYNVGLYINGNSVSITWTDPADKLDLSGMTVAWKETRLVYKSGSVPANENDGTVVLDCYQRNMYKINPYTFTLTNPGNYYFALFTCTMAGTWNTTSGYFNFRGITKASFATVRQMMRAGITLTGTTWSENGTTTSVLDVGSSFTDASISASTSNTRVQTWVLVDEAYTGRRENDADPYFTDASVTKGAIFVPKFVMALGNSGGTTNLSSCAFDAPEASSDAAGNTNDSERVSYGYNNWEQSNIRQWLNASGYNWFVPQNPFDLLADNFVYGSSRPGFKSFFKPSFLELVMPVKNKTLRNTLDGGGYYLTTDTFWLLSEREVKGVDTYEGNQLAYFAGGGYTYQTDSTGTLRGYRLRSAQLSHLNKTKYMHSQRSGTGTVEDPYVDASEVENQLCNNTYNIFPAFCIA